MSDRNQNESVSHALLALGIVSLLIFSIIIAWVIVCCERCRRKRKYRPGQQSHRTDPGGGGSGSIIRSGPSPLINRHLLVPKASQHLVIANKAFLSKSTPHLVGMEELLGEDDIGYGHDENSWRLQGISTPTPSEPLFSSPYKVKGHVNGINSTNTTPNHAMSRPRPRPGPNLQSVQQSVSRSRSEPVLPQLQPGNSGNSSEQGSVQELSIHDQILAILGTFPSLGFDFFIPTKSSTPLRSGDTDFEAIAKNHTQHEQNGEKDVALVDVDMDVEQGPESSVDGDVLLSVDVDIDEDDDVAKKIPLLPKITLNGNGLISPSKRIKPKPNPRPTTLKFVEETRYDFVDVEVTIETEVGNDDLPGQRKGKTQDQQQDLDLPPLLETTL